jgi:Zn-dependent peptidase ImmA (M78 family)/transcriptional regulator with XRE-family HTH domain
MIEHALERIRAAMKRRSLTHEALGERVGLSRATVNRYLNGHRQVPADVLLAMASVLELTLADLVTSPPETQVLLRSSLSGIADEPFFRRTVERLQFYGRAMRSQGDGSTMDLPVWRDVDPDDRARIAQVAGEVRLCLGLARRGPVLSMFQHVNRAVKVLEFDAGENVGCDGFVVTSPEFGTGLAVRRALRLERKRATLAHELGHVVLHRDQLVAPGEAPREVIGRQGRDPREQAAWTFAAAFLLPAEDLHDYASSFARGPGRKHVHSTLRYLVIQLKHDFGLSASMTLVRLREEKLVTEEEYRRLRTEFYGEKGAERIEEPFPLSGPQCEGYGSLQSVFERLVALQYFEEGDLSESRLGELLELPGEALEDWISEQVPMFTPVLTVAPVVPHGSGAG